MLPVPKLCRNNCPDEQYKTDEAYMLKKSEIAAALPKVTSLVEKGLSTRKSMLLSPINYLRLAVRKVGPSA